MDSLFLSNSIYVYPDKLGVFARQDIEEHEVIEHVPVIVLPESQLKDLEKTDLYDYVFGWGIGNVLPSIGLGFTSFYRCGEMNGTPPNAHPLRNLRDNTITIISLVPIKQDEEILIAGNQPAIRNSIEHNSHLKQ